MSKFVFEGTEQEWNDLKTDDNWDFPKAELPDILSGDLSDGFEVYVHFTDSDGEDRYGELDMDIDEASEHFGKKGVPMETI